MTCEECCYYSQLEFPEDGQCPFYKTKEDIKLSEDSWVNIHKRLVDCEGAKK